MKFETGKIKSPKDLAKFMFEWEDNVKRETIQKGKGKVNYKMLWRELIRILEKNGKM
jgi:hypothetical protein